MDTNTTTDILGNIEEKPKLPTGLNVLTILTFIGSGIFGLFTLFTPFILKWSTGLMDKALTSGQELSQKQIADIEKGKAALELANQYMIPNMIIGSICIILCILGAIWMRKQKKDGYWIYTAGELVPIIAGFALMGTAQITGISSIIFGIAIPVLFVVLYTLQRKHLKY